MDADDVRNWIDITFEPVIDFIRYLLDDWVIGLSFTLSMISTVCCMAIVIMKLMNI